MINLGVIIVSSSSLKISIFCETFTMNLVMENNLLLLSSKSFNTSAKELITILKLEDFFSISLILLLTKLLAKYSLILSSFQNYKITVENAFLINTKLLFKFISSNFFI